MHNKTKGNYNGVSRRVISMVLAIALICSFGLTSVFAESGAGATNSRTDSGVTVTVSAEKETIAIGEATTLTAVVEGDGEAGYNLTWSSDNDDVVTLEWGEDLKISVTGVGRGTSKIDVSLDEGVTVADSVTITVMAEEEPATEYNITVKNGISDMETAAEGDIVTITGKAVPAGEMFDKWTSTTSDVIFEDESIIETSFTMPASDVTVVANYVVDTIDLEALINKIEFELFGDDETRDIFISEDGKGVPADEGWVTQAAYDTFVDAIDEAILVLEGKETTFADVEKAYDALEAAYEKFRDAIHHGLRVDKKDLLALYKEIGEAYLDDEGNVDVLTSSKNGTDIPADKKWVTPEAYDAFTNAVGDALEVLFVTGETQDEVDKAFIALEATYKKFMEQVQKGKAPSVTRTFRMDGVISVIGFEKYQLKVFDVIDHNTRKDITSVIKKWSSSDTSIATVKDGKGGGLVTFSTTKLGKAIITAFTDDDIEVTCRVMVIPDLNYNEYDNTIQLANAYILSTYESDDGVSAVPKNMFWAPTGSSDAFELVLYEAQNAQSPTATQATIDAATAKLKPALNKFIAKLKMGTLNEIEGPNLVELTKAIIAAEKNYEETNNASPEVFHAYFQAIEAAYSKVLNVTTQAEADKALADLNKATATFNAAKTSTGGSSNGGNTGSSTTPSVNAPSSNVGATGEVKSEDIKQETTAAVAEALKANKNATANVTVKNADAISPAALKDMAAAAKAAGGKAQLMADSVVNGAIEARLYIDPTLATTLKESIKLGVKTNSLEIDATKEKFAKYFANEISIASFEQQGSFGMEIQAAVKLDLTKLDTKKLVFYSYDKATNTYVPIVAKYTIDKNGYVHFTTAVGGDIIITDKALTKKK